MATRHSGAIPFNASSINPLTGVPNEAIAAPPRTVDRASAPFFVKRQHGEAAYQPPEKSVRKPIGEDALTKPISSLQGKSAIIKTLDQLDNMQPRPISSEHVLQRKRPAAPEPVTVVHLHAPPPFATTSIVLSARVTGNQQDTVVIPRSAEGVQQLQNTLKELQHSLEIREASTPGSPTHAAGIRTGSKIFDNNQLRKSDSFHGARSSSSRKSSRPASAMSSRRPSLSTASILADAQVAPQHAHPISPSQLPPAGRSSTLPLTNRPLSDQEARHYLGSSVDLSHPIDFCDADVGKPKAYKQEVRHRIAAVTAEQERWAAAEDFGARTSGTQTPAAAGTRSGSASPSKKRTVAWTNEQQSSTASRPSAGTGLNDSYNSASQASLNHADSSSAPIVPQSLLYTNDQWDAETAAAAEANRQDAQEQEEQHQLPIHTERLNGLNLRDETQTWRPSTHGTISPRVTASLTQRPAGLVTQRSTQVFGHNFVPVDLPVPLTSTVPASHTPQRTAPHSGSATPNVQHHHQPLAQSQQAVNQSNHHSHVPTPPQQTQVQHQSTQVVSSAYTGAPIVQSSYSSSHTPNGTSRAQAIEQLQSQLAQLQRELRQIHTEASSGMTTPSLHSAGAFKSSQAARIQPANAAIYREMTALNSGNGTTTGGGVSSTTAPRSSDEHGSSRLTIEPLVGNSATGFVPLSLPHTPRSSHASDRALTPPAYSSSSQTDVSCVTSRAPAGKVSKSHVNLSTASPSASHRPVAYSIAHPPAPPTRFHPNVNQTSSFEGASLVKIIPDEVEPNRRKRVEKTKFVHPDDEPDIEIISARTLNDKPKEYIHLNTSLSLPSGGPLLYDRYEERPSPHKRRVGPGPLENKIHAYYQQSELSSPITVKIKKAPAAKLWKV